MAAAAMHFRESQAIDRAIKEDPNAYQSWVKRQLVLDAAISQAEDEGILSMSLP